MALAASVGARQQGSHTGCGQLQLNNYRERECGQLPEPMSNLAVIDGADGADSVFTVVFSKRVAVGERLRTSSYEG